MLSDLTCRFIDAHIGSHDELVFPMRKASLCLKLGSPKRCPKPHFRIATDPVVADGSPTQEDVPVSLRLVSDNGASMKKKRTA
jgi:hypothetical protein